MFTGVDLFGLQDLKLFSARQRHLIMKNFVGTEADTLDFKKKTASTTEHFNGSVKLIY